jgi:hypothetical protein
VPGQLASKRGDSISQLSAHQITRERHPAPLIGLRVPLPGDFVVVGRKSRYSRNGSHLALPGNANQGHSLLSEPGQDRKGDVAAAIEKKNAGR